MKHDFLSQIMCAPEGGQRAALDTMLEQLLLQLMDSLVWRSGNRQQTAQLLRSLYVLRNNHSEVYQELQRRYLRWPYYSSDAQGYIMRYINAFEAFHENNCVARYAAHG